MVALRRLRGRLMGSLSYKRNNSFSMLLCEWKVKGEIAPVCSGSEESGQMMG
jgi:hypothetical protein